LYDIYLFSTAEIRPIFIVYKTDSNSDETDELVTNPETETQKQKLRIRDPNLETQN
jgi:hypothetical protein